MSGISPSAQLICPSAQLEEGGAGQRFAVDSAWGPGTGFVVRYQGAVYGYLNQCAHVPIELDWQPGIFFDTSGLYLVCATHGACYEPDSGICVAGPCRGKQLHKITVIEEDGQVYWVPSASYRMPVVPITPINQ